MNNLSETMQARLDKWRKNTLPVANRQVLTNPTSRRNGKNDYGDANTLDEWELECKNSQTRK
jgi:hypothetical protein